jgi:hypothetical protein
MSEVPAVAGQAANVSLTRLQQFLPAGDRVARPVLSDQGRQLFVYGAAEAVHLSCAFPSAGFPGLRGEYRNGV